MFMETDEGRLQNLYLLQDVIVVELEKENPDDKPTYAIGYVQMNGVIMKEGKFESELEADAKREEIVSKLLVTE